MLPQRILVFSLLVSVAVSSKVLRLAGSSVQLHIQKHGGHFNELKWMFNTSIAVVKYYKSLKIAVAYLPFGRRVEINEETQSLTLKNLQKSDSGLYEAKTTHPDVSTVAEYTLSVLEPVAKPDLTADPDPQSNDPSNVTFNCSVHNISVRSSCYNCTCEKKNVTGEEDLELFLYDNGRSIICQIHNPLSSEKSEIEMIQFQQLCPEVQEQVGFNWPGWLMGVTAVGVVVIIVVLIKNKL